MEPNRPWWYNYRRKRYKPRSYLTIEMVLRKSIVETTNEYLKHCSIAGVSQICNSTMIRVRLLWLMIFCVSFAAVCYFLFYTWTGTLNTPLIVTTESLTYPINEIDFPAVAVCNVNRISRKVLEKYLAETISKMKDQSITIDDIRAFYLDMERLIDFGYPRNRTYFTSLDMMITLEKLLLDINPSITDFMKEMAPNCDEMLTTCAWQGSIVDCNSIFSVRRTIRGHCCVFNYVLDYDSADKPGQILDAPKRQVVPGNSNGLIMVMDPVTSDYAHGMTIKIGFDVFLFEPTLFLDPNGGRVSHLMIQSDELQVIQLHSEMQIASEEVRKYSIETRKCLFHDELQSEFKNMYSYSACLVKCKIESIQSLCKCTPYFFPSYKTNDRICGIRDLKCLNKYKEKFMYLYPLDSEDTEGLAMEMIDSLYCPQCLPDCELTQHFSTSYIIKDITKNKLFQSNLAKHVNFTNKCYMNIYQPSSTASIFRLDVVAYWFEIISNFGGFAGIFLGLGVFTLIELLYFIYIRLIQTIIQHFITKKNEH